MLWEGHHGVFHSEELSKPFTSASAQTAPPTTTKVDELAPEQEVQKFISAPDRDVETITHT